MDKVTRLQPEGEHVPPIVTSPGSVIIIADGEQTTDIVDALRVRANILAGSVDGDLDHLQLGTRLRVRRLRAFAERIEGARVSALEAE